MSNTSSSPPPTGGPRPTGGSGAAGADVGWSATGSLLSGIIVWSLIGWGLDSWWGTRFALPVGVLVGAGLGIYVVITKYGGPPVTSQVIATPSKVRKTGTITDNRVTGTGRAGPTDGTPRSATTGPNGGTTKT